MKRIKVILGAILIALVICLSGCTSSKVKIGILQWVDIPALNDARLGFIEEIENSGLENYEIIYKCADESSTNNQLYAQQLIRKCDLVLGIATPCAKELMAARSAKGKNTPILFTAVTDPVDSNLVKSFTEIEDITGTSDMGDIISQVNMMTLISDKESFNVAVLCSDETNSKVQSDIIKAELTRLGHTCTIKKVTEDLQLEPTLNNIASTGYDFVYIPTDNYIASKMSFVSSKLNQAQILTICGEAGQLENGGCLSFSIDYFKLGKKTGLMAKQILVDKVNVSEISVSKATEFEYVFNEQSIVACGYTLAGIKTKLGVD